MKELQSAVLGKLTQDASFDDWFATDRPLGMPFFDGLPLDVTLIEVPAGAETAFLTAADAALTAFRHLTTTDRRTASALVLAAHAEHVAGSYDDDPEPLDLDDANPDSIWRYVHPTEIYISRRPDDGEMYVHVDCNCDWDEEHGLQLVFRRGRMLTRVSAIDGYLTEADAHGHPDADDALLRAYAARYAAA